MQLKYFLCFMGIAICGTWSKSFAQACGGGVHKVQLSGRICEAQYELFSIEAPPPQTSFTDLYRGFFIDSLSAGKLKPVAVDTQKLPYRIKTANLFKGNFQKKHLAFQALELYQDLFLLKITTGGRLYFVVGKFLSGCNRTTRISLGRETVELIK